VKRVGLKLKTRCLLPNFIRVPLSETLLVVRIIYKTQVWIAKSFHKAIKCALCIGTRKRRKGKWLHAMIAKETINHM
jgi:hypothetical protein